MLVVHNSIRVAQVAEAAKPVTNKVAVIPKFQKKKVAVIPAHTRTELNIRNSSKVALNAMAVRATGRLYFFF